MPHTVHCRFGFLPSIFPEPERSFHAVLSDPSKDSCTYCRQGNEECYRCQGAHAGRFLNVMARTFTPISFRCSAVFEKQQIDRDANNRERGKTRALPHCQSTVWPLNSFILLSARRIITIRRTKKKKAFILFSVSRSRPYKDVLKQRRVMKRPESSTAALTAPHPVLPVGPPAQRRPAARRPRGTLPAAGSRVPPSGLPLLREGRHPPSSASRVPQRHCEKPGFL